VEEVEVVVQQVRWQQPLEEVQVLIHKEEVEQYQQRELMVIL
jgi:hypothetical protein